MISCKDVTQMVSRSMDASLPLVLRARMRLHILFCKGCSRYERQLLLLRDLFRRPEAAHALSEARGGGALSEAARERIRRSLRDA